MSKILVTGCNGQLGRAINKKYEGNSAYELINTDVQELDITNVDEVVRMVDTVKPDVIINCAAHTNVNKCESDWDNAYRINAIGPRNLSIAATKVHARMMHISTDYVFDGTATVPYKEFDATNPCGAYGKTKLEGEKFVQQFADRFYIVRTAWLYGDGNNFVRTMLNLAKTNDEVRVVGDQFGSPTSTRVLADIIATLIETDNYGIFHGTCEGSCSWADFTDEIFRLSGVDTKVNHITTEEYPTPAKRPAYSVLEKYMLKLTMDYTVEDWKMAIQEYIQNGLV